MSRSLCDFALSASWKCLASTKAQFVKVAKVGSVPWVHYRTVSQAARSERRYRIPLKGRTYKYDLVVAILSALALLAPTLRQLIPVVRSVSQIPLTENRSISVCPELPAVWPPEAPASAFLTLTVASSLFRAVNSAPPARLSCTHAICLPAPFGMGSPMSI